jgi:hypothetical protein
MKISLYHTTLSGKKGEILQSILAEGLRVPSGRSDESNQKSGAFFNSHYRHQRDCAEIGNDIQEYRRKGKPVIISIEADLDDKSWTIDYEESGHIAKEILFDFADDICEITDLEVKHTLQGDFKITKIETIASETQDGLNIHYRGINSETEVIYLPWDEKLVDAAMTEARILEVLRDALVEKLGDPFLDIERQAIIDFTKKNKHGVSLKYSGGKNIPIMRAEIYKRPVWETVFNALTQNHQRGAAPEPS